MITKTLFNNFLILVVILAAVIVRLLDINQPLLEFFPERQTQTAEIVRNIYVNGLADFWVPKVRYFTGFPVPYIFEFPIFSGLVAVLYKIFGPSLIWGRILSITAFALSAILFAKIVSKTQNNYIVFFSLIFFVFSPLHILISRSYQPDELALFFLLFAIWSNYPLLGTLAYLTKFPTAIFGMLLIFNSMNKSKSVRKFLLFSLTLIPAIIWSFRASRIETLERIESGHTASNWFVPGNFVSFNWYFSLFQIEHIWVLTTPGLVFFIIGIYRGFADKNLRIWRNWLFLGILYFFIFNYHTATHEYYHVFLIPPLAVFVGLGLHEFLKLFRNLGVILRFSLVSIVIAIFLVGLLTPAFEKIKTGHTSFSSQIIWQDRYQYILDF